MAGETERLAALQAADADPDALRAAEQQLEDVIIARKRSSDGGTC